MNGSQNLNTKNAGINAPIGAVVKYYLHDFKDSDLVNIYILDKNKKIIKSFSTKPADQVGKIDVVKGMNQFTWDLNYTPGEKIDGMILFNGSVGGPKAAPGNYYVRIVSNKKDSTEAGFMVVPNPNYKTTQKEYEEQFDFLITVRDKFTEIQKTIKNIRDIRKQIGDFIGRQGKDTTGPVKTMADSINTKMTKIEEALYQTKSKSEQDVLNYPIRLNDKIAGLYGYASSGNYAPTKQVKEAYKELSALADVELNKFKAILTNDLPKLNQLIREKQLELIGIKKE
jgi:hypothetical protein